MSYIITEECTRDNGGCTDECTVEADVGVVCSCPNGGELMTDKKSCREFNLRFHFSYYVTIIVDVIRKLQRNEGRYKGHD